MGVRTPTAMVATRLKGVLLSLLLFCATTSTADAGIYMNHGGFIGVRETHEIRSDQSLIEIARRYDVGYNAITAANRKVDPIVPTPGTRVTVPTEWILPDGLQGVGIVINVPEMRLYLLGKRSYGTVTTFPIGVGDEGKDTPAGRFTVVEKIINPAWHVPESIRKENPRLPAIVPPGPRNPMGNRALRLSLRSVLIHGTNKPWCVGRRASHGCIRLYPEDIVKLFNKAWVGMPVTIVYQPVKVGVQRGRVFLEVHEYGGMDLRAEAMRILSGRKLLNRVDKRLLTAVLANKDGLPTPISW